MQTMAAFAVSNPGEHSFEVVCVSHPHINQFWVTSDNMYLTKNLYLLPRLLRTGKGQEMY